MATGKATPKTLVEAVQAVFDALEPFDEGARQRILVSATSLFGTTIPQRPSHVPVSTAPSSAAPQGRTSDRPLSPVELSQQKQPATNQQRIALFAYYREKVEGLSRFAKDDLQAYFAKARQPHPKNFDRDYRQAVGMGWIYDDGSDSYLTSKGLEVVEAGFGGKALPRGSTSGGKKKARRGGKRQSGSRS